MDMSLSKLWEVAVDREELCPTLCDLMDCSTSYPSLFPTVCSNSCPLSQWCHPTISCSVAPFSSCPQSFPASGSFLMRRFCSSGGQSIGASALASVLPVNIQGWFPLGFTGLISLQSKGLSRLFSYTTVHKHRLLGTQLSLRSRYSTPLPGSNWLSGHCRYLIWLSWKHDKHLILFYTLWSAL